MSRQNVQDIYGARKEHIRGQRRSALIFLLIAVLLALFVFAALLPGTPEALAMLAIRASAEKLNVGDNAVSDYYPLYAEAEEYTDFAVSFLCGTEGTGGLVLDYLRYLNRCRDVTRIVVDLPPYAVSCLNASLGGLLSPAFEQAAWGTVYGEDEFRDFVSDVNLLNAALPPRRRISFVSGGLSAEEQEGKEREQILSARVRRAQTYRTESGGYLYLLSRDEGTAAGGFFDVLCRESPCPVLLTPVYYAGAERTDGSTQTDLRFPMGSGAYLCTGGIPGWIRAYYRRAADEGAVEALDGTFGGPFFIVTGQRREEQTAAETVGDDYDYGY